MPTSAATARATASLSPVSSTGVRPEPTQAGDGLGRGRLDGVGHDEHGTRLAVPADGHRGPASLFRLRPSPRRVPACRCWAPVVQQRGPADDDRVAVHDALHAKAFHVGEVRRPPAASPTLSSAPRAIACAIGCSEAFSSAPASRSTSVGVDALGHVNVHKGHLAGGDGAGLVQHHRVDAPGRLQHLRALDQDAELRAPAGADQQRGRRGQAERARAGDDQHRHRGGERRRDGAARAEPERERADGERDDDRARTPPEIRSASRCTAALPVCASSTSLAICASWVSAPTRVARTTSRPPALTVAPTTCVAGPDLDRHRLAGEHARVDRGAALLDHAVGGDLLARPDHEPVADRERRRPGCAPRGRPAAPRRPWRPAPAAPAAPRPRGAWTVPRSSGRRG